MAFQAHRFRRRETVQPVLRSDPRWTALCWRIIDGHTYGAASALSVDFALEVLGHSRDPRAVARLLEKLAIAHWEQQNILHSVRALGDRAAIPSLQKLLARPARDQSEDSKHWLAFTIAALRATKGK